MAGVRLVWERVRWEVRQGQVVWMEFRIPAHVAVPGSLLQVKALCSHCGGAGVGAPQSSAAGNVTYVPSCTSGLRRSVPEVGVWHRDEQSPRNLTNEP